MIIKKITTGFVVQTFDTATGACTNQEFVAGDQVAFELEDGSTFINEDVTDDLNFPFNMEQQYPDPIWKTSLPD